MATKKKATQAKPKYHCACAPGDLSAVQPVVAPPADETTAKPVASKTSKPPAAVAPGAGDQQKTK
jgi:hypothetical protein